MPRWHIACDRCDHAAWIGVDGEALDAWCEACQAGVRLATTAESPACASCGRPLSTGEPRFIELFGELQNLAAVLAAWDGDAEPLTALLPERPRFLTDLTPPAPDPADDPDSAAALALLAGGAFAEAGEQLARLVRERRDPRLERAFAIALERTHDSTGAEAAFSRAIALRDEPVLRLARGALHARCGDFAAAHADFELAGVGYEARWNRAALRVLEAVQGGPGLPAAELLQSAKEEAGPPSSEWSDHTIGRLLWGALIERARGAANLAALHAAERELEFDTFWDRAMRLAGYASLGLTADAVRVAAPLALDLANVLAAEPALSGDAAGGLATAFDAAVHAIGHGRPGAVTRI